MRNAMRAVDKAWEAVVWFNKGFNRTQKLIGWFGQEEGLEQAQLEAEKVLAEAGWHARTQYLRGSVSVIDALVDSNLLQ